MRVPPCRRYASTSSDVLWAGGPAGPVGRYSAVVRGTELPKPSRSVSAHGFAVRTIISWYFFDALAPAIALGRAARMSSDCHGFMIVRAAVEYMYCATHVDDEFVLHVAHGDDAWRQSSDIALAELKRFVRSCEENPSRSSWVEPRA